MPKAKKSTKKSLNEIAETTRLDPSFYPSMDAVALASDQTTTRRNAASTIERTDRFKNIDEGLTPFRNNSSVYGGDSKSTVDVRDAVILCQKCYYNFSIFRNIVDLMTEFSVNNIYFQGGTEKSRRFFAGIFNKNNLLSFQDQWFREYYRSGNVFTLRHSVKIQSKDVSKMIRVFGEEGGILDNKNLVLDMMVPVKYVILNPADIQMMGSSNFGNGIYYKILTDYEIFQLRNPKTDQDKAILDALPERTRKDIANGIRGITIALNPDDITMAFYKKQDYEPFAVPMGYPVLEDINFKYELKKIDMAIARTMQQIVLLVTTGTEPEKGGVNKAHLEALQKLFANQSVGRVLIADYTTKAQFIIPQIADLLDPRKYEIVDRDINIGLNNIFASDEKFANQAQKIEIFVARLEAGRRSFLHDFLIPEIRRISESMNFKSCPTPYFEEIELKDNTNYAKIYARLVEVGALTVEQGLKAISTNILPDPDLMLDEQEAYKEARDKGLYVPLIGGPKEGDGAGSPGGAPPAKAITPIGKGQASAMKFDLFSIKDNVIKMQELEGALNEQLKKTHKIARLTKAQKLVSEQLAHLIVVNEEPENWTTSIASYLQSPVDKNIKRVEAVMEIAAYHDIDPYLAGILYISQPKPKTKE